MFLQFFKALYKNQPKLFYLLGSFCLLQLFLSMIKLEVTPFFLYGMFSEKVMPSDTLTERSVWVDGKQLNYRDLRHKEHLLIDETAKKYILIKKNQSIDIVQTRVEQKYPFLTQSSIYPFLKPRIYNAPADVAAFEPWFKKTCEDILHRKIQNIAIKESTYAINPQKTNLNLIKRETIGSF